MVKGWANKLHNGDSIAFMRDMKARRRQVDLIFADPPFNIGYDYDVYEDRRDAESYLKWSKDWIGAASDVLKPSGAFWIAIGDEYVAELKVIAEGLGLELRNWVIWYYTFGVHCTHKFTRSHTHLLYFVKSGETPTTFNEASVRVPSARQLVYADRRANEGGRVPDNTWILRPPDAPEGAFDPQHSTWYFSRVAGTFGERAGFHSCQMPEKLLARIIDTCSDPDNVVFDPFAGSSSTLVVAKKLGRQWLGCELSEEYVRHGTARIDAARAGQDLEGPSDPLLSAPTTRVRRKSERLDDAGLIAAFLETSEGYPIDRVIADPILNAAFLEECSRKGLAGRAYDWNTRILALRKQGRMPRRSMGDFNRVWNQLDPFLFASEIALQKMLSQGYSSLDAVLCDPASALRFDEYARSFSPGFSSFDYRWGAFALRKDARKRRLLQQLIGPDWDYCGADAREFDKDLIEQLPEEPAVYLIRDSHPKGRVAYVGETANARQRAASTYLALSAFDRFAPRKGEWLFSLIQKANLDVRQRKGFQSRMIVSSDPVMNFRKLMG